MTQNEQFLNLLNLIFPLWTWIHYYVIRIMNLGEHIAGSIWVSEELVGGLFTLSSIFDLNKCDVSVSSAYEKWIV